MNTQELIKQAEELLSKCSEGPWEASWQCNNSWLVYGPKIPYEGADGDLEYDAKLMAFARNHLPEIIATLKKYGGALYYIANADLPAIRCVEVAKKALEE